MADKTPPKHTHTAKCYTSTLNCAKTPHTHTDRACYYQRGDKAGQLKCSQAEHEHTTSSCYSPVGPLCGHL